MRLRVDPEKLVIKTAGMDPAWIKVEGEVAGESYAARKQQPRRISSRRLSPRTVTGDDSDDEWDATQFGSWGDDEDRRSPGTIGGLIASDDEWDAKPFRIWGDDEDRRSPGTIGGLMELQGPDLKPEGEIEIADVKPEEGQGSRFFDPWPGKQEIIEGLKPKEGPVYPEGLLKLWNEALANLLKVGECIPEGYAAKFMFRSPDFEHETKRAQKSGDSLSKSMTSDATWIRQRDVHLKLRTAFLHACAYQNTADKDQTCLIFVKRYLKWKFRLRQLSELFDILYEDPESDEISDTESDVPDAPEISVPKSDEFMTLDHEAIGPVLPDFDLREYWSQLPTIGDDMSVLHVAVLFNNTTMIGYLLFLPDLEDTYHLLRGKTKAGWTPLHLATVDPNPTTVRALLKGYTEAYDRDKSRVHDKAYSYGNLFIDKKFLSPLHYAICFAIRNNRIGKVTTEIVKLMLTKDGTDGAIANLRAVNTFLLTPLHVVCLFSEHGEYRHVLAGLILEHAKSWQATYECLNARDCCGYTPLHWAVRSKSTELVSLLLSDEKIKPLEEDAEGHNPLDIAIRFNMEDNQKELLRWKDVRDEVLKDRETVADSANAILVGAALIASVSFGGYLQPPQGWILDGHYAVITDAAVQAFWIFNLLAFLLATATVLTSGQSVRQRHAVLLGEAVKKGKSWLMITVALFTSSVVFVLAAFITLGVAALPPDKRGSRLFFGVAGVFLVICLVLVLILSIPSLSRLKFITNVLYQVTTTSSEPSWRYQLLENVRESFPHLEKGNEPIDLGDKLEERESISASRKYKVRNRQLDLYIKSLVWLDKKMDSIFFSRNSISLARKSKVEIPNLDKFIKLSLCQDRYTSIFMRNELDGQLLQQFSSQKTCKYGDMHIEECREEAQRYLQDSCGHILDTLPNLKMWLDIC